MIILPTNQWSCFFFFTWLAPVVNERTNERAVVVFPRCFFCSCWFVSVGPSSSYFVWDIFLKSFPDKVAECVRPLQPGQSGHLTRHGAQGPCQLHPTVHLWQTRASKRFEGHPCVSCRPPPLLYHRQIPGFSNGRSHWRHGVIDDVTANFQVEPFFRAIANGKRTNRPVLTTSKFSDIYCIGLKS